ncbi:hypothetical protein SAMN05216233_111176 [Desulfoluna spongiiphila]|uniref:Uncharacterized protein n=1 Tax=Desulfoluna spongiiphila TaxID=419481 RepID=A0A1G5GWG0_9BACT|nr:hypothetical protein SAMN05216233_111176 [Desulfoluna spongiiphila]
MNLAFFKWYAALGVKARQRLTGHRENPWEK